MNIINILKRIALTVVFIIIFILGVLYGTYTCKASEVTIADYEATIEENNKKINICEEIKNQLHIVAETIRKQTDYDKDFVQSLSAKWQAQNDLQHSLIMENERIYKEIERLKNSATHVYIGDFKITHYCICSKCCGKSPSNPNYGITSTGTRATPGRTIAVDPRKIPYGTKVIINGHTYVSEDCGGAIKGNRIDICVSSHSEALRKGVLYNVPVYIVKE